MEGVGEVMRLLRTALLSLSLLPVQAQATGNTPFTSPSKLSNNQKLCEGKNTTAKNHVPHFSKMLKKVAWYQDRDNSMKDIDINEDSVDGKVGRAMAIFLARSTTQSIQVCKGVFLTTAHSNLDDPRDADCSKPLNPKKPCKNRPLKSPSEQFKAAFHYPIYKKTLMKSTLDEQFISPRKNYSHRWDIDDTDYVFIKIDKPVKPDEFIIPIKMNSEEIINAFKNGFNTYLYRGKTRYKTNSNGLPDFIDENVGTGLKAIAQIYKKPQKVNVACKLAKTVTHQFTLHQNQTIHDCPTESTVSGSPMITIINNKPYISGIHAFGNKDNVLRKFNNGKDSGAIFINSSKFCGDYEKVCGRPCVTLDEALKEE